MARNHAPRGGDGRTRRRKPRVGRPPLPPGEARHAWLKIRITADEHALLRRAADKAGNTLSEYVRESMLVTAREELGPRGPGARARRAGSAPDGPPAHGPEQCVSGQPGGRA